MKRILLLATSILTFGAIFGQAQTLTVLPSSTQHEATLGITNNCASGVICSFNIYRCTGAVSTCSPASAVWLLLTSSPISVLTYTDSAVTAGTTYSYVAYATANGETAGPSNEVAATIPLGPTAPGLATSSVQ